MAFSGLGAGTVGDPYQITTLAQLNEIRDYLTSYFKVMNNIDASETETWNDGQGFLCIGRSSTSEYFFSGQLNGNQKTISNLYINNVPVNGTIAGLFSALSGSVINVCLDKVQINAQSYWSFGGLVGIVQPDGMILQCKITNSEIIGGTSGATKIGGLCAYNYGILANSFFDGTISAPSLSSNVIGGVCAYNLNIINGCFSIGQISGGGTFSNRALIGGFCGVNGSSDGSITNSYSQVNISALNSNVWAGGFVGNNQDIIEDCWSSGTVNYGYGFAGMSTANATDCFFDSTASGLANSGITGCVAKTTAEMFDIATFSSSWDIAALASHVSEEWFINDTYDYPRCEIEKTWLTSAAIEPIDTEHSHASDSPIVLFFQLVKAYVTSTWVYGKVKAFVGGSWVFKFIKYWNGSSWIEK